MVMVGFFYICADTLFSRWATHVLVMNTGIHGQLFVATDVERSNCVLLIGALQR